MIRASVLYPGSSLAFILRLTPGGSCRRLPPPCSRSCARRGFPIGITRLEKLRNFWDTGLDVSYQLEAEVRRVETDIGCGEFSEVLLIRSAAV